MLAVKGIGHLMSPLDRLLFSRAVDNACKNIIGLSRHSRQATVHIKVSGHSKLWRCRTLELTRAAPRPYSMERQRYRGVECSDLVRRQIWFHSGVTGYKRGQI